MNKKFIIVIGVVVAAYYFLFKKQNVITQQNVVTPLLKSNILPQLQQTNVQPVISAQQQRYIEIYRLNAPYYDKFNKACEPLCTQTGGKYTPYQFNFTTGTWDGGFCSTTAGQAAVQAYMSTQMGAGIGKG